MGKRRVKQQNVSVIGLFNVAGRHKKMDDVFVYTREHSLKSLSKKKKSKTKQTTKKTHTLNPKQHLSRVFYSVCLFMCHFYIV